MLTMINVHCHRVFSYSDIWRVLFMFKSVLFADLDKVPFLFCYHIPVAFGLLEAHFRKSERTKYKSFSSNI